MLLNGLACITLGYFASKGYASAKVGFIGLVAFDVAMLAIGLPSFSIRD